VAEVTTVIQRQHTIRLEARSSQFLNENQCQKSMHQSHEKSNAYTTIRCNTKYLT